MKTLMVIVLLLMSGCYLDWEPEDNTIYRDVVYRIIGDSPDIYVAYTTDDLDVKSASGIESDFYKEYSAFDFRTNWIGYVAVNNKPETEIYGELYVDGELVKSEGCVNGEYFGLPEDYRGCHIDLQYDINEENTCEGCGKIYWVD